MSCNAGFYGTGASDDSSNVLGTGKTDSDGSESSIGAVTTKGVIPNLLADPVDWGATYMPLWPDGRRRLAGQNKQTPPALASIFRKSLRR